MIRTATLAALLALAPTGAGARTNSVDTVKRFFAALEAKDRTAAAGLLADDVTVEYPFDRSGRTDPGSWRKWAGKPAVLANYVDGAFARLAKIDFADEVYTLSKDGRTVFMEARGDMLLANGTPYRNLYVFRVDVRGGRIVGYKEYLNPVTAALASGAPLGPAAEQQQLMSRCDAGKAQFAMGKPYSDALAEQARAASGSRAVRRLRPGQAVTMEFSPERLSLETDEAGTVIAVRCG